MTRRITRAILLVAGLLVLGLGVPLAIGVQRFYENRAVIELQRRAAEAIAEISIPLDPANLARAAGEPDAPEAFSVYGPDGRKLFGPGPSDGGPTVRHALDGDPATDHGDRSLVVATPITERVGEHVVGVMVVSQPASVVAGEARRAWLLMAIAVAIAFVVALAVARAQARRLAAPISRLAARVTQLGRGDFTGELPPSGIEEVDTVAAAMDQTAVRLAELLARERAFSADVSHQLRTPLAGLRLRLEHAMRDDDAGRILGALAEVDRLEGTIDHLLALARDAQPVSVELPVLAAVEATQERWEGRFEDAGRRLEVSVQEHLPPVRGSAVSIAQVLDVLLDNALRHGAGTARVLARAATGGLVIEVGDDGPGVPEDRLQSVFERREGSGSGIGLGLARTITEAEGGRLLLAAARPPRFQVVLPATAG
jgi:signal transduction histidine kinase